MVGAIVGYTFGAIWLAWPLWAAFDAEERNRSGILWALLTLISGPLGLGVYALTSSPSETGASTRGRHYFFTGAFFFLTLVYGSLVGLVAVAIDAAWASDPIGDEYARVATAIFLALLVFALPLWAFHWVRAQALVDEASEERDLRAVYSLERRYGAAVMLIGALATLGFGIFLAFTVFASVLGVFEGNKETFFPVIASLPLTLLVLAYHYAAIFGSSKYRTLGERFANGMPAQVAVEPPPPASFGPPAAAGPSGRFCGQCGAPSQASERFCTRCGSPLHTAPA